VIQVVVNGAISGLLIALYALGFQFVYLTTRTFHIASAGVFTLVPYIALAVVKTGKPVVFSLLVALVAGVLDSALCELLNHRLLMKRQASEAVHMMSSLGILIVLVQGVSMIWGDDIQVSNRGVDLVWKLGKIAMTSSQVVSGSVSLAFILLAGVFLKFSSLGLRLRALADNVVEFSLLGYNVMNYRLVAFCVSGLLIGVSALLLGNEVGFDPHGGLHFFLLAVVAVILGGRSSFAGPIVGGILIGIIRSGVTYWMSARWEDACTFLLLAAFLYFWPRGLFSARLRLEATE